MISNRVKCSDDFSLRHITQACYFLNSWAPCSILCSYF